MSAHTKPAAAADASSPPPAPGRQVARRLLVYLNPYMRPLVAVLLLTLALNLLRITQPKFTQYAVDWYIIPGDLAGLRVLALAYAAVLVLIAVLTYLRALLLESIGLRVTSNLRCEIYDKFQRQEIAYFDRTPVGRMLTTLSADTSALRQMFTTGAAGAVSDVILIAASLGFMLWIDWRLTLVTLITVPPLFGSAVWFRKNVRSRYETARTRFGRIFSFLNEHLQGAQTVQMCNSQGEAVRNFRALNGDFYRVNSSIAFYEAVFSPLTELIGVLGVALIIWYGGFTLIYGAPARGAVSLGALIAFIQYSQQLFLPVRDLLEKYNSLQSSVVAARRVFAMLDLPVAVPPSSRPRLARPRGRIEFQDVWFAYKGEDWVLKGVSFVVEAGQTVALVGRTGSGKSTITNLILRFYDVQRGRVLIDGVDVRDWEPHALRQNTAVILQDVLLFSGTIESNITLGRREVSAERVEWVKREMGLEEFFGGLPDGWLTSVRERGTGLSAGQRQLISVARALVQEPALLILDEATSLVDAQTERMIQYTIEHVRGDATALVIAHRLSTIGRSDHIIVLDRGEISEQGSHRQLLERRGLYRRLFERGLRRFGEAGGADV